MSYFLSIIWDATPEIFPFFKGVTVLGTVRWYGVLWAMSFLAAHYIVDRIYQKIGRDRTELDTLFMYTLIGCIAGARLGHCLFYGPYFNEYYPSGEILNYGYLSAPWRILYIWEGGLASHGAGIGLLIACYLFYKKVKAPSYLWVLDKVAITIAIAGCFIRFGNFMNSEINGVPSDAPWSVAFVHSTHSALKSSARYGDAIEDISYDNLDETMSYEGVEIPAKLMTVTFKKGIKTSSNKENVFDYVTAYNNSDDKAHQHIMVSDEKMTINQNKYSKKVFLVTRHPSQMYESLSCLIIFIIMLALQFKVFKHTPPEGLLIGIFLAGVFALRFIYEFTKESQVMERGEWALNTGQLLSIPAVIIGIGLIIYALKPKNK